MSARVVWGHLAPAGKHHPTAKWSLLMALLVVVVLGVPARAVASPPSVQTPTGPGSGGVFTGTYTFSTYIYCSGGFSFSSSYSNSIDGTHNFAFYGAADGSLLVSIDGGGRQLITSCGDPLTGPDVNVANYTVSKNTAPPTPTPTPTPAPTPAPTTTPVPPGGGTSGGGSSSGGSNPGSTSSSPGSRQTGGPTASIPAPAADAPAAAAPPTTNPVVVPQTAGQTSRPAHASTGATVKNPKEPTVKSVVQPRMVSLVASALSILIMAILVLAFWRSRRTRGYIESTSRRLAVRLEPYYFRLRQIVRARLAVHATGEAKRRGLSHHHHSGKLIAHHHTSYPALAFLIMLSAVLTAGVSLSSHADSSQLSLTVLGPPPTVGATIDQPASGDHFAVSTQTVRGTCPLGLLVELYRNGTFGGSTLCDAGGLYSLLITLTPGQNDLIARDLDGLNQYGPNSAVVRVFYDAPLPTPTLTPAPTLPAPVGSKLGPTARPLPVAKAPAKPAPAPAPFYLDTAAHFYQGADATAEVMWQVQIHGGQGPYQVTWAWSDGHQDTSVSPVAGDITGKHRYVKPGAYHVTVRAFDVGGQEAVISLLAIINGSTAAGITRPVEPPGNLIIIWPTLVMISLLVLSFWLGERHKSSTSSRFVART